MHELQPWCAARVVELLNDATVLRLQCADVAAWKCVAAAVWMSGAAVRSAGAVWSLAVHDAGRLAGVATEIMIEMLTEWSFACRCELAVFLSQASHLHSLAFWLRMEWPFMQWSWRFMDSRADGIEETGATLQVGRYASGWEGLRIRLRSTWPT